MYPERIPHTFYPTEPWKGHRGQPMFGFHVHECDSCHCFAVLQEVEVCTFAGSRFEQPEFDAGAICYSCLALVEMDEAQMERDLEESSRYEDREPAYWGYA